MGGNGKLPSSKGLFDEITNFLIWKLDSGLQQEISRYTELNREYLDYHYPPILTERSEYMLAIWRIIDTQWRTSDKHLIGIDAASMKVLLDAYNIKLTPDIIDCIGLIEQQYIKSHSEAIANLSKSKT